MASVYDHDGGQVIHYVDGRPVTREAIQSDVGLRLGDMEIGNWDIATYRTRQPTRHFTGCMDEFVLFSRALRETEVQRLYIEGRPPR